jgi:uncharacterized protein YydD (DUF2326 family)
MFLKELLIHHDENLIRKITFKKGLNLIIDETLTSDITESGNNVGKTTVLRLVNYCFGTDGANIYTDSEFKEKSSSEIEKYLTENNIIISLTLKDNLEIPSSKEVTIRRNFLKRKDKLLEINGEKVTSKNFQTELKEKIFLSNRKKPTIKQIVAKNIRDDENRVVHTLKVLNQYTKIEEYEALFLFWLGIEPDSNARKQELIKDKSHETNILERIQKSISIPQINQSLLVINRNIEDLTTRKENLNINENYESDLEDLNTTKQKISEASSRIGSLEMRLNLIKESQFELEKDISDINVDDVKALYLEAKKLIPDLQKSFEDTINFHNRMIHNKIDFITGEMPEIESQLNNFKTELSTLRFKESTLIDKIKKSDLMDDLDEIITKLSKLHEQKGELEEQKRNYTESSDSLEKIEVELEGINKGIYSKDDLITSRVAKLNEHFSAFSDNIYGEQFIVSPEKHEKGYQLTISNLSGNLGTGKKKGQIAAFDLAYIKFADENNIKCFHFIMQDQIENIHENQINNLLLEVVNNVNCQYIIPVLKDKLPEHIDPAQYTVASLSQDNKLFKV